jgi:hypothetical protein
LAGTPSGDGFGATRFSDWENVPFGKSCAGQQDDSPAVHKFNEAVKRHGRRILDPPPVAVSRYITVS